MGLRLVFLYCWLVICYIRFNIQQNGSVGCSCWPTKGYSKFVYEWWLWFSFWIISWQPLNWAIRFSSLHVLKRFQPIGVLNPWAEKMLICIFWVMKGIIFGQNGKPPVLKLNDADLSDVNLNWFEALWSISQCYTKFYSARLDSANLAFFKI